ncbi:MAG: hypothetical protein H6739_16265 [Alphaproteobacteria bacterium]|nr:hypothetical protein [Alphaproteobacteria bacterium]
MISALLLPAALAAEPCAPAGLLTPVRPAAPAAKPVPRGSCLNVRLELAGEASQTTPAVGLSRQLALPRARAELGLRSGGVASARVAVEAVRSGGQTGYLGVDGESLLPRLQIAEARADWRRFGLAGAAGLIDDPWVVDGQRTWGLPAVQPTFALSTAWMERADLGVWVAWTAPLDLATVSVAGMSGEGYRRRERNDGQDVSAMLTLRPLAPLVDDAERLAISAVARSGSLGIEYARNHRVGLRISAEHPYAAGGVELLAGWGLDADADREPGGLSAWARTGRALPAVGWGRVDVARYDRTDADSAVTTLQVGGGPALMSKAGGPPRVYLALGYEGTRYGESAAPLAGTSDASATNTFFVQLGANLRGDIALEPSP